MSQTRRTTTRSSAIAWAFTAPYALLLLAVGVVPALYAIYGSFNSLKNPTSLSFDNYAAVVHDFRFLPAIGNVALFTVIWIPVMVFGTILLALLLHEKVGRFSSAMRLVFFLPGAVTGSAAVLLWYFMLDPQVSPFAPSLHALGLHTSNDVFTSSNLAPIFALVAFITGVGQWIVIMFGALQGIPQELLESARIDGAGPFRTALLIKLPLIRKYVVYMLILAFAAALQIFAEPSLFYSITKSGSSWWSLNQLGYTFAFAQGDFGQAATVSVVLMVVSAAAALFLVFKTDFFKNEEES
ncbi:multiple sugar transport system permease protein [Arthrobacter pascens]|jgi:multiple sugar transport system permease protein|uniref:carbohydrate ABC transporter permease n=1 Tax=Arthrobacter pascens TaxID=1677 RepID=UPI00277E6576|nr:sugar ABC transporter permease [Arthrobacter pascens]MDQ0634176.1 multiple sugar transport system permease protein [Arthrobacter pascens]